MPLVKKGVEFLFGSIYGFDTWHPSTIQGPSNLTVDCTHAYAVWLLLSHFEYKTSFIITCSYL